MDQLMVTKRNGEVAYFDQGRIKTAIVKAFTATNKVATEADIDLLVANILREIHERFVEFFPNVENIQDIVEKHLMLASHYDVAKSYILYRERRKQAREEERKKTIEKSLLGKLTVKKRDGRTVLFNVGKITAAIRRAKHGLDEEVSTELITKELIKNIYDGITTTDIEKALLLSTTPFIELNPAYGIVAARLFMDKIYKEVIGKSINNDIKDVLYRETFIDGIRRGVEAKVLDEKLLSFDLNTLSQAIKPERDEKFPYIGVQTIYERYLMKIEENHIELPQTFWMRVAMGLAINESNKNERALEFYEVMSTFRFTPSTPTLFHAGTNHPQLSSCYLTTVNDDLAHIFKCVGDNAQLSKWSGGLGNDWTSIRATGSWIKGTNVESQGVIPFLKIANDVTMAINRSGKRRGATCAYLETWHLDIEDFLDLRKNTGDERRRTHDMNTANWIPDLFMKRVMKDEEWTLFSPNETPDLHETFGRDFERRYTAYERLADDGKLKKWKRVSAKKLWRKMLSMLFETGHPWITFKDPCNIRSPQDHVGVVHSSNLCTEITLNTSATETAVCNLGSVNLVEHIIDGALAQDMLSATVLTATRMLDNVIDINFYPTIESRESNFKHRPVGLGIMGLQDALFKLKVNFESPESLRFCDQSMEMISYYAILGSSLLAKEKGTYPSYKGSKWERGLFPIDTLKLLEEERGMPIPVDKRETLDWAPVREHVRLFGMRNSNTMAIAPTATISNIVGSYPSIEPIYKNIYVKANISGEFTVVNEYLIEDLKRLGLWSNEMLQQLKYNDGSLENIDEIPLEIKNRYKEAFEIDPEWCIALTAARAKWIDQSQSHNVFLTGSSGKQLNRVYLYAWEMGLKTTYYLRTMAASQIEKSTLDASKFGFTQKRDYANTNVLYNKGAEEATGAAEIPEISPGATVLDDFSVVGPAPTAPQQTVMACLLNDPGCESCQ